ncbi:hypothetical protein PQX77_005021 [Marasmius sp. AFHP31]|nr:hypothetical protein PQX77_005021 [Marasmius sp. AFHP31]
MSVAPESRYEAFLEAVPEYPGITCLSLNRPKSKNAISVNLLKACTTELTECLDTVQFDNTYEYSLLISSVSSLKDNNIDSTRVLILKSTTPDAFCAGADLVERRSMSQLQVNKFLSDLRAALGKLENLPVPTIAAIDGPALGGGLEMSLACDLRVAGELLSLLADMCLELTDRPSRVGRSVTKIGLPETSLGIIPGAGGTQRAARILGISKAKDLIYTARMLSSSEALECGKAAVFKCWTHWANYIFTGLVDYVSDTTAYERSLEVAEKISRNAPLALRAAKQAISRSEDLALEAGLDLERTAYETLIPTKDRIEALNAFKEKRRPQFRGE